MKKQLLALLLLLCLATQAWAARVGPEAAIEAYNKGDYETALKIFRALAEEKSVNAIGAQYNLGYLYETGKGVSANAFEAAKWYRKAAERGHPYAQFRLGDMYAVGKGLPLDMMEAYFWFALAAGQGFQDAHLYRDTMAGKLTADRLEEAKRMVREFKPASP